MDTISEYSDGLELFGRGLLLAPDSSDSSPSSASSLRLRHRFSLYSLSLLTLLATSCSNDDGVRFPTLLFGVEDEVGTPIPRMAGPTACLVVVSSSSPRSICREQEREHSELSCVLYVGGSASANNLLTTLSRLGHCWGVLEVVGVGKGVPGLVLVVVVV